jgi:uncharacterized protein YdiU (UPF0061 family)
MPVSPRFQPSTAHASLGADFYDPVAPACFPITRLIWQDQIAATRMGLETLSEAEWIAHFARFEPLPGSFPQPLALRYHGHQFRVYNPDLGDGRGFLFAQARDTIDGRLMDFGTKGSGQTPWSRAGDGRLTLKGGMRELLATNMLAAQGVTTSRTFALFETGEALARGDEPSPTRSSVLTRLSHGHIRIGSFQRFAYLEEPVNIEKLARYSLATYYPHLTAGDSAGSVMETLLDAVVSACARLGSEWMAAGFVHGVLNSDNINITGESFDYGPWRWLPIYDPAFTAAYFDQNGLYAYGRQPATLAWNLTRLAECFLGFCPEERLTAILAEFQPRFEAALCDAFFRRLGIQRTDDLSADLGLVSSLYAFLHEARCGFEQTFFDWYGGRLSQARAAASPQASVYEMHEFRPVKQRIIDRDPVQGISLDHAYFRREKPVTMLIDEVEAIWAPIAATDDWTLLHAKLADIAEMTVAYSAA